MSSISYDPKGVTHKMQLFDRIEKPPAEIFMVSLKNLMLELSSFHLGIGI